ncbi:hypothetical protein PRUPE_2G184300 [Prunus persica]|uniref:Uncharacterized protein n=1 Tax=Prunus persica TaxID=3760 RepID=A0A251QHP5_PRUPE|nr:hypothetical protein PRUPE_2G184300 [Prunus persica]
MQETLKRREEDHQKEEAELGVWDCGSPLYDSYELVTVSHLIERHLMALPSLGRSRRFITNLSHLPSSEMASLSATTISSREGKGSSSSSMVGGLSEFMGIREIWKRRVVFGGRKDKAKKMKTGLSGFCNLIDLWRQKDHR